MDNGKTEELLRELLKKLNESKTIIDVDDAKKFEDSLARLNKITQQNTSTWGGMLKQTIGVTKQLKDLSGEIEQLDDEIEKLADATDQESRQRKEQLQLVRENMRQVQQDTEVRKANIASVLSFSKTLSGSIGIAGQAMGNFAKQLQSGTDAFSLAGTVINAGIDIANTGVQAAASGMSAAGNVLSSSTNPKLKTLGVVSSIAAPLISGLGNASAQTAKFLTDFLLVEAKKLSEGFNKMSASGAMFAGGMGEMSQLSHGAGLSIKQFSEVVARNSEALGQSGLGVSEGARQIGRVANDLKKSGVRDQLMNLGYSVEEQADLIAQTTANMRRGAGGKSSDGEIAAQTAKYAENLRTIAAITGEDAKKKVAEAQQQNQILAFQQELAKKSPEQRAQIDAAMATMTEQEKKNFRDRVVLGTVVNQEGAIYEATVKGAREKGENALQLFNNNELTAKKNAELNAQYGEQIKDSILSQKGIATAGYVVGGQMNDVAKSQLDALNQANTYTKEGVAAGSKAVEDQKNTHDETTNNLNRAQLAAQDMAIQIEDIAQKQLPKFGEAVKNVIDTINKQLGTKTSDNPEGKEQGAVGKAIDSTLNWLKTPGNISGTLTSAGAVTEVAGLAADATGVGAVAGIPLNILGGVLTGLGAVAGAVGFAKGGWSEGGDEGYLQKLHGKELIIPTVAGGQLDTSSLGFKELMKTMDGGMSTGSGTPGTSLFSAIGGGIGGSMDPKALFDGIESSFINNTRDMFKSTMSLSDDLFSGAKSILGDTDTHTDKMDSLTTKMEELISAMGAHTNAVQDSSKDVSSGGQQDIGKSFADMQSMMQQQLDAHKEMISHMRDTKDYTEKLLRVSQ
jgi:hypothetical protein